MGNRYLKLNFEVLLNFLRVEEKFVVGVEIPSGWLSEYFQEKETFRGIVVFREVHRNWREHKARNWNHMLRYQVEITRVVYPPYNAQW